MGFQDSKSHRLTVFSCCWMLALLPWMWSMGGAAVVVVKTDDAARQAGIVASVQQTLEGANFYAMHSTSQTPMTLESVQTRSQQYPPICRPDLTTPPVQPGIVTLLRISTMTFQDTPPNFQVDSTISKLVIQVTSTDPLSTIILDPNGESINTRSKREAVIVNNQWEKTLHHADIRPPIVPDLSSYSRTHRHTLLNEISQTVHPIFNNGSNIYKTFRALVDDRVNRRRDKRNKSKALLTKSYKVKGISNFYKPYNGTYNPMTSPRGGVNFPRHPPRGRTSHPWPPPGGMTYLPRHPPCSRTNHIRPSPGGKTDHPINLINKPAFGSGHRDRTARRRRSAHVTNTQTSEQTVRWDIDLPDTGIWTISTTGVDTANITVMAVTSLDFRFEFFDLTKNVMDDPPIANDNTLMRLYVSPAPCVVNITRLDLLDDTGLVIGSVDSVELIRGADDVRWMASVMSPRVPFYVCLRGYDATGLKFQRINPSRVVPRMFVISFGYRPDPPLSPERKFIYSMSLRNKDRRDTFKLSVQFSNQYFMARLPQSTITVNPGEMMPIYVVVNVSGDIYFKETSVMVVTARRMSDNLTDTASENLTAVPEVYKLDHEPPTCSVVSTQGGCRPGLSCSVQRWSVDMMVADGKTGVASANFVNTETGTYTVVRFSYVTRNHTAVASYRYTCCNPEAVLEVRDYVSNTGRCLLRAPLLDPLTSATTTATRTTAKTSAASASPILSPVPPNTFTQGSFRVTESRSADTTPDGHVEGWWSDNILRSTQGVTGVTGEAERHTGGTDQGLNRGSGTAITKHTKLESWDDDKYSTLKLGAIIVGAIGGTAGLAIILVCATYKCRRRGETEVRAGRNGSNASDITMGGSWESRSDASSGADSIRLKKMIESDESSVELGTSGYATSSEKSLESQIMRSGVTTERETNLDDRGRRSKGVHFRQQDGVTMGRGNDDVEDVIFRCVVVSEEDSVFGKPSTVRTLGSETSTLRTPGSEFSHRASYSPMLKSAGRTYASMVELQRRMQELEAKGRGIIGGGRASAQASSSGQGFEMTSRQPKAGLTRSGAGRFQHEDPHAWRQSRGHGQTNRLGQHREQNARSEKLYDCVVQIHQQRCPPKEFGLQQLQVDTGQEQVGTCQQQVETEQQKEGIGQAGSEQGHRSRSNLIPGTSETGICIPGEDVGEARECDCDLGEYVTCACRSDSNQQRADVAEREAACSNISSDYYPRKLHPRQGTAQTDVGTKKALRLLQSNPRAHNKTTTDPGPVTSKNDSNCKNSETGHAHEMDAGHSRSIKVGDDSRSAVQALPTESQISAPEVSAARTSLHAEAGYTTPRLEGLPAPRLEGYTPPHPAGFINGERRVSPTPEFRRRVLENNFNAQRRRASGPSVESSAHEDERFDRGSDSAHRPSSQMATRVHHTSPNLSYVHRGRLVQDSPPRRQVSAVITISDQSQWELHHNIQQVRDKLLMLQSKVDRNLEVDAEHVTSDNDSD